MIGLVAVAIVAIQYSQLKLLSVFSVSQITLQETAQGYEDPETHEWQNSYWIIALVTDTLEHYEGISYTFNDEDVQGQNQIGTKTLVVTSEVKITIKPLKPYWERNMEYETYTVYPRTYASWMNSLYPGLIGKLDYSIGAMKVRPLRFALDGWKLYTPFEARLYKNNVLRQTETVNTFGGTSTIVLKGDSEEETVKIQNLGKLGTGLGEPGIGEILVFGGGSHIFKVEGNIVNEIKYDKDAYSFSRYWFGGGPNYYAIYSSMASGPVMRWTLNVDPELSPAHYWIWGGINKPIEDYMFPGVYRDDTATDFHMYPVAASLFGDKAAGTPKKDSPFGYGLLNYLANERNHKVYTLDDFDEHQQGISIVDNKMRLYLPLSSFNNIIAVWISTEIADAIVYHPVAARGKIVEAKWLTTGTTSSAISDKDLVQVKVRQDGRDGGRITVTASGMTGYPMSVSPVTDSVILDYGETYTFNFMAKNLGTGTTQKGTLNFVLSNDDGEQTDETSLVFELKPQLGEEAYLTVQLYDKGGSKPSGIYVTAIYGIDSESGVTSNGFVTFNLGSYRQSVSIGTQETDFYRAASTTIGEVRPGDNKVLLKLEKKTTPPGPLEQFMEWIRQNLVLAILATALIVAACFVIIVLALRKK